GPCLGLVARSAPPDVEWPAAWGHVVVPVADVVASAEAVRSAGHWVGEVRRDDDGDVPALAVRLYDPDGYVVELVGSAVMP
ncbi:MAG TPA: hypothetical protein VJ804_07525, partial [Acidimicrobiales bacterium]|nr:hypothetical protein [Acidimicrobiales bacterium]